MRTVASGLVGTYGAMLLAVGSSGRRYAQANAIIHLQQPLTELTAHTRDLGRHAEQLLRLRDQIVDILTRHTGQQPERIRQDMVRDPFLTPAEAVGYGLVDAEYPLSPGHSAPSMSCREGLTTLPGHGQLVDL